jgi:hypothetical protein
MLLRDKMARLSLVETLVVGKFGYNHCGYGHTGFIY